MKSQSTASSQVSAMEPMLPDQDLMKLAELSRCIFREAGALSSTLPAEDTRQAVALLVRQMNSYYSNLIEGHKTLPRDIERAMKEDFSTDEKSKRNQQLAAAHIRVETELEKRLRQEPALDIHSEAFLCWIHRAFYENLPEDLRQSRTVSGKTYRIDPGQLRAFNVDVGRHTPPDYRSLQAHLARFSAAYGDKAIPATDALLAIAAAHHRLTWIHPFGDGNGRVARLYSHAALIRQQVDGMGLWTLSRGLARSREEYYRRLAAADQPRRDDYDGRGPLTARGLAEFCVFFLDTALEQILFMRGLLELAALAARIENYLYRESPQLTRHMEQLSRLLRAVLTEGRVERGRVSAIVGLKPSAARLVTRLGLDQGLLRSTSPKGPLVIAFPAAVLESYFPRLFLDLPVDE